MYFGGSGAVADELGESAKKRQIQEKETVGTERSGENPAISAVPAEADWVSIHHHRESRPASSGQAASGQSLSLSTGMSSRCISFALLAGQGRPLGAWC